jgi:hypothetical protein
MKVRQANKLMLYQCQDNWKERRYRWKKSTIEIAVNTCWSRGFLKGIRLLPWPK